VEASGRSALAPRLIAVHEWLGTTAVMLFVVLASWRWNIYKRDASPSVAYLTFDTIVVLALVYQGSLGEGWRSGSDSISARQCRIHVGSSFFRRNITDL
jgi:uncharacterized membrane protein